MDPIPSKGSKRDERGYTNSPGFEMYANETVTKRDVKTKKIRIKHRPGEDVHMPSDSLFQIPENDKIRPLAGREKNNGNQKHSNSKNLNYPSHNLNSAQDPRSYNLNESYLPSAPQQDRNIPSISGQIDNQRSSNLTREQVPNELNYNQTSPMYTNKYNKIRVQSENPEVNIKRNSSLICKAINYKGEPVTVNNEVIRDKLVLSCRPRTQYGMGSYHAKTPSSAERDPMPNYIYPPTAVDIHENIKINQMRDIEIREYQKSKMGDRTYMGTGKPVLDRADAYDHGSLGLGDRGMEPEQQGIKYEEQYRVMQCKRYSRNFKGLLWGFFVINLLLVLVGLALLLLTMSHLLFHSYINSVLLHVGFVRWVWLAMGLSVVIILVGIYGMVTAIHRHRKMIRVWCVLAVFLIILILIYLLIYWLSHAQLKRTQKEMMLKTFNMYRCQRWVRSAWDTLHESFQCCGIEARGDWKYIPPSCCTAETKFEKVACINHFIKEEYAFKSGCRTELEDYFTVMFLLITCLLFVSLILLILGILVALWLLKMYKVVLQCRDLYMIKP